MQDATKWEVLIIVEAFRSLKGGRLASLSCLGLSLHVPAGQPGQVTF